LEREQRIRYIYGFENGEIRAHNNITRAEVAMVFFRLRTGEYKHNPAPVAFGDVSNPERWYAQAINYMAQYNTISGFEDGEFKPANNMTRAEFVAVLSRIMYDDLTEVSSKTFSDVEKDHWALKYIHSAHANGWISGYGDDEFRPNQPITRAEVMVVLNMVFGRELDTSSVPYHIKNMHPDLDPYCWSFDHVLEAIRPY
jgi:hypothetical protein